MPDESIDPWTLLRSWFPDIEETSWSKLQDYADRLLEWNNKVNLVSRKDADQFVTKHLAHSLVATKFLRLMNHATLLDVGTGGGLPGIPLAICYPHASFTLIDSIAKKIMVVQDITKGMGLKNVKVIRGRAEELPAKQRYDFVLGRAVTRIPVFHGWIKDKLRKGNRNSVKNGLLYWKGGDYKEELKGHRLQPSYIWDVAKVLPNGDFEEKYILHFSA
jgi:16S rRNA (guanine527-N7)-methyltransferase